MPSNQSAQQLNSMLASNMEFAQQVAMLAWKEYGKIYRLQLDAMVQGFSDTMTSFEGQAQQQESGHTMPLKTLPRIAESSMQRMMELTRAWIETSNEFQLELADLAESHLPKVNHQLREGLDAYIRMAGAARDMAERAARTAVTAVEEGEQRMRKAA